MAEKTKRFMHIEDNGDGTMTWTMNFSGIEFDGEKEDGEDLTIVIPASFENMLQQIAGGRGFDFFTEMRDQVLVIPESPEGA